jgi:hypothetical protein
MKRPSSDLFLVLFSNAEIIMIHLHIPADFVALLIAV